MLIKVIKTSCAGLAMCCCLVCTSGYAEGTCASLGGSFLQGVCDGKSGYVLNNMEL